MGTRQCDVSKIINTFAVARTVQMEFHHIKKEGTLFRAQIEPGGILYLNIFEGYRSLTPALKPPPDKVLKHILT